MTETSTETTSTETLGLLRQLIQNGCVNDGTPDSGHEYRSVSTIADYLGSTGTVVEPVEGRQSVVYRVPGTDPQAPALLLMGHTDVVPANPDGWSRDPFGAEIGDGFVWGRGAVDMLNVTASMAVVFKPFLTGDLEPLAGDLLYLAVADEEAAGGLGARHLVSERWDLVGAPYVLTEIAYPPLDTATGVGYPVSVGEKGPFWTVLRSSGIPGHGSMPYLTENALRPLVAALAGLFETPHPVAITDEWRAFVEAMGPPPRLRDALLDPDRVDEAIEEIAADDPQFAAYVHACTHLTVSPNVMSGGIKANVIPESGSAQVDVRGLPGHTRRDVDQHLAKAMGVTAAGRVEMTPVADHPANSSPLANPLWEATVNAIGDLTGSKNVVPTLMPATTDARFFRSRGSIAYGVGLFDRTVSFGEFLSMFHGHDERVSVTSVDLTTRLLEQLLERWRQVTAGSGL